MQLHSCVAPSRLAARPLKNAKPVFSTGPEPARLRLVQRRAAADEELDDNPFFNDAFKSVLMEALSRQEERKSYADPGASSSSGNGTGSSYSYYSPPSSDSSSSNGYYSSNNGTASNEYYSSNNGTSSNGHYSSNGSSNGYSSTHHIPDSFATSSFSSYSSAEEETAPSLQEEVLMTALGSSKTTLNQLRQIQAALERAIEREEKQVERLEFALQKARTDAAYYASLEQINRSRRRSWRDL